MSVAAIASKEPSAGNAESGYANEEQTKTFREFFKTYNTMSEICFNLCVWDFGTNDLRSREDRCVMKCIQKYMDSTKEIGRCFAEGQETKILGTTSGADISSPGVDGE